MLVTSFTVHTDPPERCTSGNNNYPLQGSFMAVSYCISKYSLFIFTVASRLGQLFRLYVVTSRHELEIKEVKKCC